MNDPNEVLPSWAPRVKQALVRQLYENDAQGIHDLELIDKVGWGLLWRCQSLIAAVEALHGRALCPACGAIVEHRKGKDEVLQCSCGWSLLWKRYHQTFQHKQLSGADSVIDLFQEYIAQFPKTRDTQQKMLWIDHLIHGWHWNAAYQMGTRTCGVNLIEGNYRQVVEFLDQLSYGPQSTPGLRAQWQDWREKINRTADLFHNEGLRRKEG